MSDVEEGAVRRLFMPVAIAALLFELAGCVMFALQMQVDPATLPPDQRAMWDAAPAWIMPAYAVAVGAGLAGAILLLMKRRAAVPLLLVSLVAMMVQFSSLLLVPALRNLTASDDLLLPFVLIVVGYSIWHFARLAARRGVLR